MSARTPNPNLALQHARPILGGAPAGTALLTRCDGRRWWKEAQEGSAIDAPGLPYAAAPAGPTSYGMRVLSMFLSDQTYTLRRADELLEQTAAASARSYALLPADLFAKARDW